MHMEKKGVHYRSILEGGSMAGFTGVFNFFSVMVNTIIGITRKIYYRVGSAQVATILTASVHKLY